MRPHAFRPRALVVDDDPDTREIVAILLQENGFEVAMAGDGAEALRILRAGFPFEVVLLDLWLPEMGGDEVLAAIRADERLRSVAVAVLTGAPVPAEVALAANAVLRKPFDADELIATATRLVGAGGGAATPPPATP